MNFRPSHASATSEPMPMDYARARLNMVNNQLRPNRVDDPNVLDAMAEIPRERFLPKALRGVAYADEDLPLPDGSWLIEPRVLARLIQAAGVRPTDVVLVIGCSTGYAGVVLSRLAATVILVEPKATAQAVERLLDELGVDNAAVVVSDDPAAGDPSQAPFDIIFVVGSVASVPAGSWPCSMTAASARPRCLPSCMASSANARCSMLRSRRVPGSLRAPVSPFRSRSVADH
jgi:protein-L-isoaspartate(D-aspartate) O-methyltransferase